MKVSFSKDWASTARKTNFDCASNIHLLCFQTQNQPMSGLGTCKAANSMSIPRLERAPFWKQNVIYLHAEGVFTDKKKKNKVCILFCLCLVLTRFLATFLSCICHPPDWFRLVTENSSMSILQDRTVTWVRLLVWVVFLLLLKWLSHRVSFPHQLQWLLCADDCQSTSQSILTMLYVFPGFPHYVKCHRKSKW